MYLQVIKTETYKGDLLVTYEDACWQRFTFDMATKKQYGSIVDAKRAINGQTTKRQIWSVYTGAELTAYRDELAEEINRQLSTN